MKEKNNFFKSIEKIDNGLFKCYICNVYVKNGLQHERTKIHLQESWRYYFINKYVWESNINEFCYMCFNEPLGDISDKLNMKDDYLIKKVKNQLYLKSCINEVIKRNCINDDSNEEVLWQLSYDEFWKDMNRQPTKKEQEQRERVNSKKEYFDSI